MDSGQTHTFVLGVCEMILHAKKKNPCVLAVKIRASVAQSMFGERSNDTLAQ